QAAGLVQEPRAAARHRQAGAPRTVLRQHFSSGLPLPWHPGPVSETPPPALIAEVTKRAGHVWIAIDGQGRPRPAWHSWRTAAGPRPRPPGPGQPRPGQPLPGQPPPPGAAYVVTGPGEQALPGLAGSRRVTVIVAGDQVPGGLLSWTAAVSRVEPGS